MELVFCSKVEGSLEVICGKYEKKEGGWRSYEVKERYGVGLWKAIKKY